MRPAVEMTWMTSLDDVRRIENEWRTLAAVAQGVTPFQYPDWILPWYDIWAADRVHMLTARDDRGVLCAVIPAALQECRLELAGSGVGDYLAPVIVNTDEILVSSLERALSSLGLPIRFNDVPVDCAWASSIRETPWWQVHTSSPCPVAPLPESSSTFRQSLPSGLRRNVRRYWEQLKDDADARFETAHDDQHVPAAMDMLVALHTKRWHERGLPGVLAGERIRRFHTSGTHALRRVEAAFALRG